VIDSVDFDGRVIRGPLFHLPRRLLICPAAFFFLGVKTGRETTMNLWTEYEGRTIDGAYPLTKLIQPEGRSAFFSTSNGTGKPTVIRLIESHFDGDEILTRWRGVEALKHPNLVKLKSFGHVTVDETSLVYAVMEPVDANLGAMLRERRLTESETKQVAMSLLAALEALHSNGFVHEHVVAENVLAVGEEIKLRSDCIREALEGEDGIALKRKDVRDYATVLLEALTQQRTLDAMRGMPLPAPFEQIVRKGMSGEWGLAQIGTALKTPTIAQAVARAAAIAEAPAIEKPVAAASPAAPPLATPPSVARRIRVPVDDEKRGLGARGIAYGVGTLLIVLLLWFFMRGRSGGSNVPASEATAPAAPVAHRDVPVAATRSTATNAAASASPVSAKASSPAAQPASGDSYGRWRVIAFTYSQEEQARQKAAAIAQEHPDLSPTVFTPNGRSPYLVTLGGTMSRQDAFAFSGKAKREGMPKDTYAQNYRGNGN
jgi:eukaryotic-like serine/threonine-protein kinase